MFFSSRDLNIDNSPRDLNTDTFSHFHNPLVFLEGEDLDVHNITNDSKDFYPKFIDLVVHCNVLLLVSALPIIGPPINAFPTTARHANAHLIIVPPTSAFLALLFLTIDLAIVATNDSCVIIDEYVPHKVLPKS
jgi:hypothetical protein